MAVVIAGVDPPLAVTGDVDNAWLAEGESDVEVLFGVSLGASEDVAGLDADVDMLTNAVVVVVPLPEGATGVDSTVVTVVGSAVSGVDMFMVDTGAVVVTFANGDVGVDRFTVVVAGAVEEFTSGPAVAVVVADDVFTVGRGAVDEEFMSGTIVAVVVAVEFIVERGAVEEVDSPAMYCT